MNKDELKQINGGISIYTVTNFIVSLIYLVKAFRTKFVR